VNTLTVLFVGCPTLGPAGLITMRRHLPQTIGVIWDRGRKHGSIVTPPQSTDAALVSNTRVSREEIEQFLVAQRWDLMLSFYNDMIFSAAELAHMILRLNIHPSLPALAGRGYDTVPLIEGHASHGATLHFLEEEVDSGGIIRVNKRDLEPGVSYRELRRRNQDLCLQMLAALVLDVVSARSFGALCERLEKDSGGLGMSWGSTYRLADIRQMLCALQEQQPEHPVFDGLPDYYFGTKGQALAGLPRVAHLQSELAVS
jgi:methionyl-tRNA formyltransferase